MQNVYYIFIKAAFVTYSLIASWDQVPFLPLLFPSSSSAAFLFCASSSSHGDSSIACHQRQFSMSVSVSVCRVSLQSQFEFASRFAILAYRSRWSRAMLAVLIMLLLRPGSPSLCVPVLTNLPSLRSRVCPASRDGAGTGQGPVSCGMLTNCCRN